MDLRIAFLYPELMNIYGDRGNILALSQSARWRGIDVRVDKVSLGDDDRPGLLRFLLLWRRVRTSSRYLCRRTCKGRRGRLFKEAVERGAVILSVCGGYQMLGHYYRPSRRGRFAGHRAV